MAQSTGHAKKRTHDEVKKQALVAMTQLSQQGKVTVSLLMEFILISFLFEQCLASLHIVGVVRMLKSEELHVLQFVTFLYKTFW